MGARNWVLVHAQRDVRDVLRTKPQLDRAASAALAKQLFPKHRLLPAEDATVLDAGPNDDQILVACYPGLSVVSAAELAIDRPSELPAHFLAPAANGTAILHAMYSVVDWCAFAVWKQGSLQRSLSVTLERGIEEDLGERLPCEIPYWEGEHPIGDDEAEYPVPFHPLEFGESVLAHLLGWCIEGASSEEEASRGLVAPETIAMTSFRRAKPWWRLW